MNQITGCIGVGPVDLTLTGKMAYDSTRPPYRKFNSKQLTGKTFSSILSCDKKGGER